MNWGDWTPQENVILSIREVLQEALIPDNEIQKNVQQKLNVIQNISDFTYYLLFIISNPNYSEEIRSLSGILLKNNINSVYDSISQEHLSRIRQECLRLLQDPCKDIRISISNVLVMLAKDNLAAWPELIPFLMNSFDASNEFSEIALNTLFKICEELIRNNKADDEIYGVTRKVFPKLNEMLNQEKCTFHHDIIRLVNQFLQEYFMIVKQSLDLGLYLRNVMKHADSDDIEMQKQVSLTFVLYLDNRDESLLPHLHEVILYLLAKTQHKDSEVALQACEFWFTATKLTNCKELLTPYMEKLLPILLKNMKYSDYELSALKDCLGNDSNEKDQSKDIYRKCPYHLISFLSRIVIEYTRKRCKKQPIQCGFNPSENAYEPLKLMHTVIEVTNEVCFSYKLSLNVQNTRQNMAVSNPLPPPEAVYNVVSVSALKNSRRKMEDRHIVVHDLNTIFTKQDATPSHYYAVFDGHDGEDAAVYSANHLHQFLAESTNFITEPEQALRDAFCRTDSMFLSKCESENIVGGTTAVCALLLPKEKTLYIAWTGDSQAVLVSQGKVKQCVKPHKPDREDERIRIEKEGGIVIHWGIWRVNGQLGVSRAIGDAQYKPYVTAVPDIVKIPLGPEDDFFVLGSDGLWDHVSEIDVAKIVYDAAWSCPDKADLVSRELVQLAKCNGSSDNISVVVVFLRHPRKIAAGPRWTDIVVGMEAIDNANDPFVVQNKANGDGGLNDHDNVVEGLLLNNINDDFDVLKKKDDMPNNDLMKMLEKSNLARLTPEFDKDDNLGPETDVDNPDGGSLSPNVDAITLKSEAINNNQQYNPFNDIEKALELNLNLKEGTFEGMTSPEEETCPPQANSVHHVSQLIDAGAESDSEEEEEWNYVSGQEVNKENVLPLQLNSKVAEEEEEDDTETTMSQLNPNAAEFVPISPTRVVASPIGRVLCDEVLSESPKRAPPHEVDLNVPSPFDFENDISQKPHEIDEGISNGHDQEIKPTTFVSSESLSMILANNNDDELGARGHSRNRLDEFHFGPNAAPFTPVKLLDQSEASSTRAVFGDESVMTLGTSFNDSQDDLDRADLTAKDDPMTASFHQERDDVSNPFDPNKVHMLPDDDEEEVEDDLVHECNLSNSLMNDTISDLAEHFPLGNADKENNPPVGFLVTDLDNDDHRSSSENRVISPFKSDRTESPFSRFDSRTNSPSEHDRISIPFEEERSVSPIQDNKVSSPSEHENLFPPTLAEHENESCRLVPKAETPELTRGNDDCLEADEGIILEDTLPLHSPIQLEDVSSALQEADSKYLKEDNHNIVEETTSTLEGDKEKSTIEEKEMSSPLIEEGEKFTLEENFEVKKEKFNVEEKEVSSPLEDEDVLSQLESRNVKLPHEGNGGVSRFGEEDVSSSLEEKDVVSPLEERTESYPAIKEINLTSQEEERSLISQVEEKDLISPVEESGLRTLVEERNLSSPVEERGLTSFPVEERDLTCPVEETGLTHEVKEVGLISPVEERDLNSPVQEMSVTSPVENLVSTFETQKEEIGLSIEQITNSFSMQKFEEEKSTLLQTEEYKSELISAEQGYKCSSEPNKDVVVSEESKTEVERKSENIPVEQKSENVEDLKLSFQIDNEFSSSSEHRNKDLDLDDCILKREDRESLLQEGEVERHVLSNSGEVEGEQLIPSPLAPSHPQISSDSEKLTKDTEKEEVIKVEHLDVLSTGTSSDGQRIVSTDHDIKTEADSSDEVAAKTPKGLVLSPLHSDDDDLVHSHPTPEYDQLLAQSYAPLTTSNVESSSVIQTSSLIESSAVGESSVETESVATTEVNSFLGRSPLQEIQSPLSSNVSYVIGENSELSTAGAPSFEATKDCLSPPRTPIQEFTNLTSTPSDGRPSSLSPLASQVLLDVTAKSPSKLTSKEAEKKTTRSSKITPSSATAKKAFTTRSSLSATSKTSPSPRPAAPSKTSKPATTKTDSAAASKATLKPIAATKTTSARVPLTSRPLTKPAISNGLPRTIPKTNAVAPTKKTVEGTARSTTSAVGNKATSTGPSKGPVASSKSSTVTGTASSARSATATAAPPKPRSSAYRPPVPKPATATKATSALKTNSSSTTLKAPTVSKSSTTSLTNRVPISARSQQTKSPHATTEKQIKETTNKLTASKYTTATRTTATTKKIEEKSSTTTTKRTTTDSAAAAPAKRPPIRRPTAPSDTKMTATKVGKPKQNGVAAVVTEQIIVNKTNQQQRDAVELNGLANGDSLFVKDNSPVDNKLIVDSQATTETAAN